MGEVLADIDANVRLLHRNYGTNYCDLYEDSLEQLLSRKPVSEREALLIHLITLRKLFRLSFPTRAQAEIFVCALRGVAKTPSPEGPLSVNPRSLADSYLIVLLESLKQAKVLPELVDLSKSLNVLKEGIEALCADQGKKISGDFMTLHTACATAIASKAKSLFYTMLHDASSNQFKPRKWRSILQAIDHFQSQRCWTGFKQFHRLMVALAKSLLTVSLCENPALWELYAKLGIDEELKPMGNALVQIKYDHSKGNLIYPKNRGRPHHTAVWRCTLANSTDTFVVKECKLEPNRVRICEEEFELVKTASSQCPYIVNYIAHYFTENYASGNLVMKDYPYSLKEMLRLPGWSEDETNLKTLAAHLITALEYLESIGVFMNDVKPANILVKMDRFLNPESYHICDFNCFTRHDSFDPWPMQHTLFGTPGYMAPEIQAAYQRKESHPNEEIRLSYKAGSNDVFALGMTLLQVCYRLENVLHWNTSRPQLQQLIDRTAYPWLKELLSAALQPESADRPTFKELKENLVRRPEFSSLFSNQRQ